jgi:hypothetical protein
VYEKNSKVSGDIWDIWDIWDICAMVKTWLFSHRQGWSSITRDGMDDKEPIKYRVLTLAHMKKS